MEMNPVLMTRAKQPPVRLQDQDTSLKWASSSKDKSLRKRKTMKGKGKLTAPTILLEVAALLCPRSLTVGSRSLERSSPMIKSSMSLHQGQLKGISKSLIHMQLGFVRDSLKRRSKLGINEKL